MLQHEDLEVSFEGFTVSEINAEDSAKLRDNIKADNPEIGMAEFLVASSSAAFVRRVLAWPYLEECTDENKRVFYKGYKVKADEVIAKAEKKIKEKREELLGNLLSGATGT